jgi:import inner membrane translocase subunit TIM23
VLGSFRVSRQPEFLFSEEATVHRRSWSENLTYYTGVGYLAGALLGGARGAAQAVSAPVALAGVEATQLLRLNQLLNTSGKLGRSSGNALGVLGLLFASFESFSGYMTNGQVPDEANTLVAGAATGAIYRSVRGPRQAAAAAVVGAAGGAALLAARKFVNPGL